MASRRALNATDESMASFTSSTIEDAQSGFRYLDAAELQEETGVEILRRSLSTRSVISTTSSFAERFQLASTQPHLQVIREIGEGLQGTVFEQVGISLVLKKEKPQNSDLPCKLKNEFRHHEAAFQAFDKYRNNPSINCDIMIPRPQSFIAAEHNDAWSAILPKLPAHCRVRTDMVEMDRVLPMPKIIRRALIEELYPFSSSVDEEEKRRIIKSTLETTSNKDCLIRPYLGLPEKRYSEASFSLRNIILGFNNLRRFDTNLELLAQALGRAYAILHWEAHINGDDIEFVLGTSLAAVPGRGARYQQRKVGLYLIDFGQCDAVDMSKSAQDVYQNFRGALVTGDNACFIPKPRHTPGLFTIFKNSYSSVAKQIVAEDPSKQAKFDIDEFMALYEEYVEDFL